MTTRVRLKWCQSVWCVFHLEYTCVCMQFGELNQVILYKILCRERESESEKERTRTEGCSCICLPLSAAPSAAAEALSSDAAASLCLCHLQLHRSASVIRSLHQSNLYYLSPNSLFTSPQQTKRTGPTSISQQLTPNVYYLSVN